MLRIRELDELKMKKKKKKKDFILPPILNIQNTYSYSCLLSIQSIAKVELSPRKSQIPSSSDFFNAVAVYHIPGVAISSMIGIKKRKLFSPIL